MTDIIKFDGNNDYLQLAADVTLHGIWGATTFLYDIEDMIIYSGGNGQVRLLGQDTSYVGYLFITDTSVQIRYGTATTTIPLNTPLPTDTLFNLKIRRSGNNHTVLVDDTSIGTVASSNKTSSHVYNNRVGFIGVTTTTSSWGFARLRFYTTSDGSNAARLDLNAATSNRTTGVPIVNNEGTSGGLNATGVNMPTDGSAWGVESSVTLPTANAGSAQAKIKDSVITLDGSASTDDASTGTLTYLWTQTSGSTVTLSDSTSVNPTFTASEFGVYSFSLVVNDGVSNSSASYVDISIPEIGGVSRYDTIKLGELISTPASMVNEEGLYFPSVIPTSDIPDVNFPSKFTFVCYASPAHSTGNGGIWLFLCEGDPTVSANWVEYDVALANGDFNYLASKPSGNPVFVDTSYGAQTETPCVNNVGGVLFMTYHNDANASYVRNVQNTCLAKSTDGINYTREYIAGNPNGTLLTYDPDDIAGNGHTGYFTWGFNPFSGVPFTYIGYSIIGGGTWSSTGMWVSNDAEIWTLRKVGNKSAGRVSENIPESYQTIGAGTLDPKAIEDLGDGTYRVMVGARNIIADTQGLKQARRVEILVANDGYTILTEMNQFLTSTENTFDEGDIRSATVFEYNAKKYIMYTGARLVAAEIENNLGIAEVTEIEGALVPIKPLRANINNVDFTSISTLPTNVIFYNPNADASYSLTANGIEIVVPSGSVAGFYLTDTADLSTSPICDLFVKGFRWLDYGQCRTTFGFFNDPSNLSLYPQVSATNLGISESYVKLYSTDVSGNYVSENTETRIGFDDDYVVNSSESMKAALNLGLRIIPNDNVYLLSSGRTEMESIGGTFNTGNVQPLVKFSNTDTVDNTVVVQGFEFGDTSFFFELVGTFKPFWALVNRNNNNIIGGM